jgi:serine/threonine protein kinase/Tfp pilus assembly protein PilF
MEATNRWERLEELFHETLRLEPGERDQYLSGQCAGDPELQREVESLVAEAELEETFIQESAMGLALKVMSDGRSGTLAGQVIGHYKILKLLGSGGMGEVYLAEDSTLERLVALKFLSGGFDDEWAKAQLVREARAVAQLDHPNICGIYGIEQIGEHNFIVMQYVEGDDVSCLLKQGALERDQALNFAEQIARGLSAAHGRGIIHRDVKPKNALVGPDGQIKILDFGLAKYVQSNTRTSPASPLDQTQAGRVIGTVAYMSPEQTRGESLTAATDVFSLGIFLYEMFAGVNPFLRDTKDETINALANYDPPDLKNVPNGFGRIVQKCLAKEAMARYSDAGEVLKDVQSSLAKHRNGSLPQRIWHSKYLRYYAAAACLIFVIPLVAARLVYVRASKVHSLVVLPIANKSADPGVDDVSEGLTRTLAEKFSYLPRLKVRFPTIPSSNREKIDPVEVGRTLRADQVLSGEILKVDGARKLHLVLTDADNGQKLWEETIDLETTNMLTLQDYITRQVTANMGMWLIGREKDLIGKRQTDDEEAMKLYMRGRQYWARRRDGQNVLQAISFFEQAKDRDPGFAKAYSGLAEAYSIMSTITYGSMTTKQAMDRAHWAARQALQIEESAEAHTSMAVLRLRYDWEWDKAEDEFKRAIALDPEYPNAHYWYANLLAILRRPDEAVKESLIARDLDPYSPLAEMNYGRALYYSRRFDEAEVYFQTLLDRSPDVPQFLNIMGLVQLQKKNVNGAIATLEKLHSQNQVMAAAALGYAYGKAGRIADANRIIGELDEIAKKQPVPPQEKAIIYMGMGEADKAFQQLETSYTEHFSALAYLTTDPLYEDLQNDPRYADLARRMRLPTTPYLASISSR